MTEIYRTKAQELIDAGYTSKDADKIGADNFLTEEDTDLLREAMEEIEWGKEHEV